MNLRISWRVINQKPKVWQRGRRRRRRIHDPHVSTMLRRQHKKTCIKKSVDEKNHAILQGILLFIWISVCIMRWSRKFCQGGGPENFFSHQRISQISCGTSIEKQVQDPRGPIASPAGSVPVFLRKHIFQRGLDPVPPTLDLPKIMFFSAGCYSMLSVASLTLILEEHTWMDPA